MEDSAIYEEKVIYGLNGGNEKIVKYSLCQSSQNGKTIYGIKVTSIYNGVSTTDTVQNISMDKGFIKRLIKYLSQNGIDDVCIRDVVQDLNLKL